MCPYCTKKSVAGRYCLSHWFGNVSYNHFLTRTKADVLKALWEKQKGRCAYTGEKLVPGVNASLDHIEPTSVGGSLEPGNLQWVTKTVNRVKTSLGHREFIRLCKKIASRF